MKIGDVDVRPLLDGVTEFPSALLYPEVDHHVLAGSPGFLNTAGNVELPCGGFLVLGPEGEVVLVDLGSGPDVVLPDIPGVTLTVLQDGKLLTALQGSGVAPADVTHVVFTHLHADHVGWASIDGRPTFPHARHYVHRQDWRTFVDGDLDESVRALLLPLTDITEIWDSAELRLFSWFRLVHSPGHTPGSVVGLIESGGDSGVLVGDVFHSLVELERPSLLGGVDADAKAAAGQRAAWVERIDSVGATVFCPHFPDLAPVTLVAGKAVVVSAHR